jgi:hypothetical protein
MDSGGIVGGAQQQQGSASGASAACRCSIAILSLNNDNFSNLFNSWISCLQMKNKGEKIRWNEWGMKSDLIYGFMD